MSTPPLNDSPTDRADPDLLVLADTVLTMEPGSVPITDAAIAVADGRITAIGPAATLRAAHPEASTIGGRGHLAIPGLINAHQHLTGDRLIRSMIPDDLEPGRSIFEWAVPAHAAHTGDDDELSATLSLIEAACNGVTFTVEAGTVAHPARVLAGFDAVGVGGTLGSWGWDVAGEPWAGDTVEDVLDRQREVQQLTAGHDRVDGWVTLVGHDLMSDELVVAASDLARAHATGITFHLSPSDSDTAAYLERVGKRPAVHLDDLGALGSHVLLGHGVHLADDELDRLLATDTAIAYCPWAYLRLGQGVSRAGRHIEFIARGGRVALGCDAENAGDAIDVLGAAALAAGLAKDATMDPTVFGAHAALHHATLGAAKALGMSDEIGSISVGKRADITIVDTTGPEWVPRSPDPVLQLVWASDGRSVAHVVSSGRVVVRDGEPTMVHRGALAVEAEQRHRSLIERANLR
ncbi:amidohydrolase family protein [Ilumatobacter nonamiensis]|uniref:amidohydrolase family protein n=1 Tax=Ilumatobacter nonamiensis TaxID=467093 RepID=UPI0006880CB0|nr:amidohydrolase family protein [Ilumatobacter nonamiensis]